MKRGARLEEGGYRSLTNGRDQLAVLSSAGRVRERGGRGGRGRAVQQRNPEVSPSTVGASLALVPALVPALVLALALIPALVQPALDPFSALMLVLGLGLRLGPARGTRHAPVMFVHL